MQYRKLGTSGLKVSAVSIGSWRTFGQSVDDAATRKCMETAYESGINYFDGAEGYGNGVAEEAMGKVFRASGWARDTYIVSSKVLRIGARATQGGLSRKHLVEACEAAIQRMGVEYLDLYFCHRPDPDTPLEEIVHTMNELIQRGRIFYWGTSQFEAADLHEMFAIAERDRLVGPTMEQTCHSMLRRDRVEEELLPLFHEFGLGTTIYSPLAVGILTGKYNDGIPEDSAVNRGGESLKKRLEQAPLDKVKELTALADELGITMAQLALAWCLKNPNVSTAIIGATKPGQVRENAEAADQVDKLTDDVMKRIGNVLGRQVRT